MCARIDPVKVVLLVCDTSIVRRPAPPESARMPPSPRNSRRRSVAPVHEPSSSTVRSSVLVPRSSANAPDCWIAPSALLPTMTKAGFTPP